jgi:ATP-binding cassette, subfamily B, bacterial
MTGATAAAIPLWPQHRLGEALQAVARALGLPAPAVPGPPADLGRGAGRDAEVARWLRAAAQLAGLRAGPLDARAAAAGRPGTRGEATLLQVAPAAAAPAQFLAVLGPDRDGLVPVLAPDQTTHWLPAARVTALALGESGESDRSDRLQRLCDRLAVRPAAREAAAELLRGKLGRRPPRGWTLAPDRARFADRLKEAGSWGLAGRAAAARVVQYALTLAAWLLVGRGALDGRLEPGWLWAWALMLLSIAGCIGLAGWSSGKLAVQLGGLTRERLVEGILRLDAEEVRTRGVGQLLGAVLETEALEALARAGGPQAFMAVVQLAAAAAVLALGASPLLTLGALALWLVVAVLLGRRYWRRLLGWAQARLDLTHELVEKMVGHRTLVAQGGHAAGAHADGDPFQAYGQQAAALDGATARLFTVIPRGWLLLASLALMPGFVTGAAPPDALAISLGGMLLVYWAFRSMVEAVPGLAAAALAWRRTHPLFGVSQPAATSAPAVVATATDDDAAGARGLLVARDVGFQYSTRPEPVLRGCSFSIRRGERILISGGSGGGKSTLGSLLTGLRQPSTGALLLGGFDQHSLGLSRWRERAGGVPQFHENHVLSAPLAFNLAMGRGWPPTAEDWKELQTICSELGLDPLLARMPAGLQQMVGDSGWQLSHGERARLFVARSLLQELDLRVLDESFAALDPRTFEQVLDCVLKRTRTLVVVAHL